MSERNGAKLGVYSRIIDEIRHAFSVEPEVDPAFEARKSKLLDKMALEIVKRRLSVPALVMLETVKPFGSIGNQLMAFLEPISKAVFNVDSYYDDFGKLMENRQNIELLISKIQRINDSEI